MLGCALRTPYMPPAQELRHHRAPSVPSWDRNRPSSIRIAKNDTVFRERNRIAKKNEQTEIGLPQKPAHRRPKINFQTKSPARYWRRPSFFLLPQSNIPTSLSPPAGCCASTPTRIKNTHTKRKKSEAREGASPLAAPASSPSLNHQVRAQRDAPPRSNIPLQSPHGPKFGVGCRDF
jgi:hypothetical protein